MMLLEGLVGGRCGVVGEVRFGGSGVAFGGVLCGLF